MISWEYSGHIHYGSGFDSCNDCGNCNKELTFYNSHRLECFIKTVCICCGYANVP